MQGEGKTVKWNPLTHWGSVSHAAVWQGGLVPAPSESSVINMTEKFQNRLCLISVCVKTDTFTETSRRNETWILLLKKYFDYAKSAFLNIFLSVSILFRMITPLFCPDIWSVGLKQKAIIEWNHVKLDGYNSA